MLGLRYEWRMSSANEDYSLYSCGRYISRSFLNQRDVCFRTSYLITFHQTCYTPPGPCPVSDTEFPHERDSKLLLLLHVKYSRYKSGSRNDVMMAAFTWLPKLYTELFNETLAGDALQLINFLVGERSVHGPIYYSITLAFLATLFVREFVDLRTVSSIQHSTPSPNRRALPN